MILSVNKNWMVESCCTTDLFDVKTTSFALGTIITLLMFSGDMVRLFAPEERTPQYHSRRRFVIHKKSVLKVEVGMSWSASAFHICVLVSKQCR